MMMGVFLLFLLFSFCGFLVVKYKLYKIFSNSLRLFMIRRFGEGAFSGTGMIFTILYIFVYFVLPILLLLICCGWGGFYQMDMGVGGNYDDKMIYLFVRKGE